MSAATRAQRMRYALLVMVLSGAFSGASAQPPATGGVPVYKDPHAPPERRIEDLPGRMTLEEKIAQLTAIWTHKGDVLDAAGNFDPIKAHQLYPAGIGQFVRPSDLSGTGDPYKQPYRDERQTVEPVNAIQRNATGQARLGIPTWFHEEALHGHAAGNAAHFPQAIALASTWDRALLTTVFTIAAREVRARGGPQVQLAPVVDIARDPRWGHFEETYAEDPHLISDLAVGAVRWLPGRCAAAGPRSCVCHAQAHDRPWPARGGHPCRSGGHLGKGVAQVLLPALTMRSTASPLTRTPGCSARSCATRWASGA